MKHALENPGEHDAGVIGLMPGLTSVELVEHGADFVTLKDQRGPDEAHEYLQTNRG